MSYVIKTDLDGIIPHYYAGYYLANRPWCVINLEKAALFSNRSNAEEIMSSLIISMKASDERMVKVPEDYEMIIEEVD